MRNFYSLLLFMFSCYAAQAQNPLVIKSVGGTVLEPNDQDQEIWQNNQWNGKFFYQGTGTPLKLCVTDGTTAGTVLLKEINADFFQFIIPAQNFIYIITERGSGTYPNLMNNVEIWKSDGTASGTVLVKALTPFNAFSTTAGTRWTSDKNLRFNYSVVGDVMYFGAWEAATGIELWRTDGTEAGTFMVKDVKAGTGTSYPGSFCAINNEVFFTAASVGFEQKLWKTDGTAAGTVQVAVPEPFFMTPYVGKVGDKMIFFATNTTHGIEPWVSDGTPAGTYMLADVNPGSANSTPSIEQNLHLRFNDKYCFFIANKTSGGKSLWRTDGTSGGTIQLTTDGLITEDNFSGGGYSDINNNVLYWIGGNQKLYKSDGTPGGTARVTTGLYNALYLKIYKNAAWFHARNADNVSNSEPYRSDGTLANTKRFDVQPGEIPSYPYGFFVKNNKLYFFTDSYAGRNLYEYNGDMTFNGSVAGGRWRDSANWNSMMTPGITDTAYIDTGFSPVVSGGAGYAGGLVLQNGASITLTAATDSLYIHDYLATGTGNTVTGAGILTFKNFNSQSSFLNGALTATNVNVQGNAASSNALSVSGNLNLTENARLTLNGADLTLTGTASSISNTAANYIVTTSTGRLVIENIGIGGRTGTITYPVGTAQYYNPVLLTNTGTADAFSVRVAAGISASYTGETPAGGTYTGNVVNATWFVNEAVAGGSNVGLSFQWTAAQELSGFDRSQSKVGHYTSGAWQHTAVSAATGTDPYTQTASGYTSFSPFGVFSGTGVLPVALVSFNAVPHAGIVNLSWTTSSETNSDYFTLERSADGVSFSSIATIAAAGNSSSLKNYFYTDASPLAGTSYYRLKETSRDGVTKIYRIARVQIGTSSPSVTVYPNPVKSNATINLGKTYNRAEVQLVNMAGAVVVSKTVYGSNVADIKTDVAAGIYLLRILTDDTTHYIKLVKE